MQMVTVGYEQARGLREKHEKTDGFAVSASRVVGVPLARLYAAWERDAERKRWLPGEDIVIRKANLNKSMRITWSDGRTSLSLNFYARGDTRSQVTVQHEKLPSAAAAKKMKKYWAAAMDRLREFLEQPTNAARRGKS
jgi:uncharacterized protein YndB with AHSA1/START domain